MQRHNFAVNRTASALSPPAACYFVGGPLMSLAEHFEAELELADLVLSQNEWAVAELRERTCAAIVPIEAFENIVPEHRIADRNPDALVDRCWMAMELARKSETTEIPPGLETVLDLLQSTARVQGAKCLDEIIAWFRILPNQAYQPIPQARLN
jgi:hypothetical protein